MLLHLSLAKGPKGHKYSQAIPVLCKFGPTVGQECTRVAGAGYRKHSTQVGRDGHMGPAEAMQEVSVDHYLCLLYLQAR